MKLFNTTKKSILAIIIILIIAFIFFNSIKTGEESTKISELAAKVVSGFVLFVFGKQPLDSLIYYFYSDFIAHIRIIAHFIEFFMLGFASTIFLSIQDFKEKKFFNKSLFFGLFIATSDETLQLFSVGRAFQLSDIFIDMMGYTSAAIVIFLFSLYLKRARKPALNKSL
jgi:VanZ family protein